MSGLGWTQHFTALCLLDWWWDGKGPNPRHTLSAALDFLTTQGFIVLNSKMEVTLESTSQHFFFFFFGETKAIVYIMGLENVCSMNTGSLARVAAATQGAEITSEGYPVTTRILKT